MSCFSSVHWLVTIFIFPWCSVISGPRLVFIVCEQLDNSRSSLVETSQLDRLCHHCKLACCPAKAFVAIEVVVVLLKVAM